MCMFLLLDDEGPGGGDELMSSKTGLSIEYVIADVLLDGDLERFMFVIRFIRLTAVDDVVDSFLSLLLFDDCEEPFAIHKNSSFSHLFYREFCLLTTSHSCVVLSEKGLNIA